MSHRATLWLASLDVSGLTGSAFKVLFYLCDHHNSQKDPWEATYPTQKKLMERAGISNGALNKALSDLKGADLIRTRPGTVPGSSNRRTYFLLGVDYGDRQTPNSGVCPNSTTVETAKKQTPDFVSANSTKRASKLHVGGDKPRNELLKEPQCAECTPNSFDFEDVLEEFCACYPRRGDVEAIKVQLRRALQNDHSASHILAAAKAYAEENAGNSIQYIAFPENWLKNEYWMRFPANSKKLPDQANRDELNADLIRQHKPYLCRRISAHQARELLDQGLVSCEDCQLSGIKL